MSEYKKWMRIGLLSLALPVGLCACLGNGSSDASSSPTPAEVTASQVDNSNPPPSTNDGQSEFECLNTKSTVKQAFFGDIHVHTKLSFDAYFLNSLNGPKEAYDYAKGEYEYLPSGNDPDKPVRRVSIGRPLDFAAVTEHAEQLGTFSRVCEANGTLPDGTNPACSVFGQFIRDNISTFITGQVPLYLQLVTSAGRNAPSTSTWQQIQQINASENEPCHFTTLNGYEFSSNKGGQVLHRNVIFASDTVPKDVYSSVPPIPTEDNTNDEWGLFDSLKANCLDVPKCDVITIPHGTNQSDGRFARPREADTGLPLARDNRPLTVADAQLRNTFDKNLEIIQHKGASECLTGFNGALLAGEEAGCGFEEWKTLCRGKNDDPPECKLVCKGSPNDPIFCQVNQNHGATDSLHDVRPCDKVAIGGSTPSDCTSPLDYARNVIPEGMALQRKLGVNPYQYGFIASSDTHNGLAGRTDNKKYAENTGHGGVLDDEPREALGHWDCTEPPLPTDPITGFKVPVHNYDASNPSNCNDRHFNPVAINFTPGGLAGVWARENTRKEIFAALKRRETFATSGSRMRIRMLASATPLPPDICTRLEKGESPIEEGYIQGVPQGGSLTPGASGPYLVVYAMQDPGGQEPGMPLQSIEIIKSWADRNNQIREHRIVLDAIKNPPEPDQQCQVQYRGPAQMCKVFQDKDFDASLGASYYARALENPSCRWSTRMCSAKGVQCDTIQASNGQFPAGSPFAGFEGCCKIAGEPGTFSAVNRFITQQERAWSSPIWVQAAQQKKDNKP
ncbi:DUF3604 domain-containing protein [Limnobacter litoralis]|uniref:DUF3604 domain-containing protein n=1 Tax=Limnobacter litoralis TaxID=481366 RepID=A0ABQ5YQE3_9BURK|nr:DUF3604 domain-containing protein [Limnobacter litoralis]GLR25069.1 hypothetical protein GCM10007875_01560 [Limnobacter litoralis]